MTAELEDGEKADGAGPDDHGIRLDHGSFGGGKIVHKVTSTCSARRLSGQI